MENDANATSAGIASLLHTAVEVIDHRRCRVRPEFNERVDRQQIDLNYACRVVSARVCGERQSDARATVRAAVASKGERTSIRVVLDHHGCVGGVGREN